MHCDKTMGLKINVKVAKLRWGNKYMKLNRKKTPTKHENQQDLYSYITIIFKDLNISNLMVPYNLSVKMQ